MVDEVKEGLVTLAADLLQSTGLLSRMTMAYQLVPEMNKMLAPEEMLILNAANAILQRLFYDVRDRYQTLYPQTSPDNVN